MRAFIAVTLPQDVREALAAIQRELAQSQADVKWVTPEQVHVTLKFLGEISDERRQQVEGMLREIASHTAPFSVQLEGLGAFPSVSAPRVVWTGIVEGREELTRLAASIEEAGQKISLAREHRPFSGHVTLGRVRSPKNRQALTRGLQTLELKPLEPWQVASVTLYQSVLSSHGPAYSVLADIALG